MSVEILSRIQFAFTVTFHYIYPPLSIGISLALIFMEGMYLKTKDPLWEKLTKFWLRVFALTFALGVATGIPLQFSLGTNWSRYSRFVGDVFGSVLGVEGVFAFMIEAGFLGLLLFGWHRVKPAVHFMATILVSLGAHFSAIWIVTANSWMHTPAGYRLVTETDGVQIAQVTNWWEMVLNPSNISHNIHVLFSTWLSGAFLIISVAAYYLMKGKHTDFARKSLKLGIVIAFFSLILQLMAADSLGKKIGQYNPEKLAAFEGVFTTEPHTGAYAFGWVDAEKEKVYGLRIPGLLSYLVHDDFQTPVRGLDQFPKEHWPWIPVVFQTYHLMIMMWGLMFAATLIGLYYIWKKKRAISGIFAWFLVLSVLFPQIANMAGWYSACMGRQPWIVYKLLKTKDAYSPVVTQGQVLGSLIMFVCMYLLFFVLFLYLLDKKIKAGPTHKEEQLPYRDVFGEEKEKELPYPDIYKSMKKDKGPHEA